MMVYEERDKAPESTLFGIAMRAFTATTMRTVARMSLVSN